MRNSRIYEVDNIENFVKKALLWSNSFSSVSYFNNNHHSYPYQPFQNILAIGEIQKVEFNGETDFDRLKKHCTHNNDWLIGYLGYDLKNQIEELSSQNLDYTGFSDTYFYVPEHIIIFSDDNFEIQTFANPDEIYKQITNQSDSNKIPKLEIENIIQEITRDVYLDTVQELRNHIIEGDIYEINYCMPFHAKCTSLDPINLYHRLTNASPTPFSVFQKIDSQYLCCASPERFIKKEGNKLISQPIKGTIQRGQTPKEDLIQQELLQNSEKERAENMMIVDLVRNDLARSCKPGSVKVEEMFGIYPFNYLFQMISTVTGELREDVHYIDAIKKAFPMGSMTGAPKIKSMELIEQYEKAKRGIFSGAVGYITPNHDFDFNVVIRSIFYNASTKQLSFQAGSAITYDADPEQEYQECMLKVEAIKQVLK